MESTSAVEAPTLRMGCGWHQQGQGKQHGLQANLLAHDRNLSADGGRHMPSCPVLRISCRETAE